MNTEAQFKAADTKPALFAVKEKRKVKTLIPLLLFFKYDGISIVLNLDGSINSGNP